MIEHNVGTRYLTSEGAGMCTSVTPYQVHMLLDAGDEARWFMRANVSELPHTDDVDPEPSIDEMLDGITTLVEMVRARMLGDGSQDATQKSSGERSPPAPGGEG
jgi:hypothetical protein